MTQPPVSVAVDDDLRELRDQLDAAPYSRLLGMRVVELRRGYAKIAMKVSTGGADRDCRADLMSLADQAFGASTNSLRGESDYVAVQFGITFVAEPKVAELLTAEGRVAHLDAQHGWGEIAITGADGRLLAKANGVVLAIRR